MLTVLQETATQALCIAIPLGIVALILRLLQIALQSRLARWFGWRVVLITGWLGTPIHELSHALMCVLFRHRIEKMALFRPDRETMKLGYVQHVYRPTNIYQVIGNFFIGTAPLVGGTLAMYGLLWLFYPDTARSATIDPSVGNALASGQIASAAWQVMTHAVDVLQQVITVDRLTTIRLWLFMYLMLCIGSHMAPSRSDYRGSKWGAVLLLAMLLVLNLVFQVFGGDPSRITLTVTTLIGLALGLWALSIVFCGVATLLVFIVTGLIDLATDRNS